ncbi:hypothetical protein M433DRAFT_505821 [Acidomyces richmondensis BFW]|nr:MAG: hypothetical protein FE78DRAFT_68772 [Acidomyces sp. 'richmondensis']KYG47286.1 hypothetical protein M433DRAFT_505821 [Acidomyces richmondensis BFW]
MLRRTVGILSTCALGASAFLIPPGVAPASDTRPDGLSMSIIDPKKQIVTIPCPQCAFSMQEEKVESEGDHDELFWIQGGANNLVLNFTVSEDGRLLRLNDMPVYPVLGGMHDFGLLSVKQVPADAVLDDVASGLVRSTELVVTGLDVGAGETQSLSPNGDMLVPVKVKIIDLEFQPMRLPEIQVKLLKTGEGELLIMETTMTETPDDMETPLPDLNGMPDDMAFEVHRPFHGPPHHFDRHKECSMLPAPLCKLKSIIESKIDHMMEHGPGSGRMGRPCPGGKSRPEGNKLPGHIKPHFDISGEEGRPRSHHGRPHHTRPYGPHHGGRAYHFHHHFLRAFAKGLVAVLIPVMAGITVGMTVSLIGLIVGRLVGFAWIKFARRGRRGPASITAQESIVEEGEDKAMLAEMEAPPVYEHAPAYVAAVEKDER